MLVLSRKINESIMVGDEVEVVIVSIHGDQVKLGINAPRNISVHRKEVYDDIQAENIRAARASGPPALEAKKIDALFNLMKTKKSEKKD